MKHQLLIVTTLLLAIFSAASASANTDAKFFSHSQTRIALSASEMQNLPNELKSRFFQTAHLLSQIWGDTILEGDYYADADVRVDQVERIYLSQAFVGYRLTYSSRAWETSNCTFDYDNLATLSQCREGRIVESGFVSSDFKSMSRDPEAFAAFQPKN